MSTMLDAALAYLAQGYSIIPITAGGKAPPIIKWQQYTTQLPTETEVREWWGKYPLSNIGIVTGRISGISVVDVDGATGLQSIRDNRVDLPRTRVIRTPNGHHLYFTHCPDLHTGAGFLPGLDVRSDGGYVVAPPSTVRGQSYSVLHDRPLATLNGAHASLICARETTEAAPQAQDAPDWVSRLLRNGAPFHERNASATRLAGYFHSKGLPPDVIATMMSGFAARCQPPMDMLELDRTIASIRRYPVRPPILTIEGAPEFEDLGDSYRFRWPQHNLIAQVGHLHQDHEDIRCLVDLYRDTETGPQYLFGPAKFNLVGTQDRSGLVRYLKDTLLLDASGMLQAMSRMAYQRFMEPEPLVYLADVEPRRDASRWCLQPYILEDHVNIWFGDSGTGKSMLALAAMMTVHSGEDWGLGLPSITHRGCYLDWEFGEEDHRERMLALAGEDEVAGFMTIMYKRAWAPIWEMTDELLRHRAEHDIGFFVADSALLMCGGDPQKPQEVQRTFQAIRRIGGTWLIIAHTTHDTERDSPFGSVFWKAMARNIWKVIMQREAGEDSLQIMLKHTKANTTRLEKPRGLRITFGAHTIIARLDLADVPELEKRLSMADRITAALRHGAMTYAELEEALEAPYNTIAKTVRRGLDSRFTTVTENGQVRVALLFRQP